MPRVARGSATICCARISEQADRRPHFHQVECHDDATRASLGRPGPLRLEHRVNSTPLDTVALPAGLAAYAARGVKAFR